MQASDDDTRFRPSDQLTAEELEARVRRSHSLNLTAREVRPLLRRLFEPVLREFKFQKASPNTSFRRQGEHYIHLIAVRFSSKFLGRFFVRAGVAVDFLPAEGQDVFDPKRVTIDSDCLFTQDVTLPNGNPEYDNGTTIDEATETIRRLIEAHAAFETRYFARFSSFPQPLDRIDVAAVEELERAIREGRGSELGQFGATVEKFVYRMVRVHAFLSHATLAREMLSFGLRLVGDRPFAARFVALAAELGMPWPFPPPRK